MDNNNDSIYKEIECHINNLYVPSPTITNIANANSYLLSFISMGNFSHLKRILFDSTNANLRIYAGNGLTDLITKYYLSLPLNEIEEIYSYLVSNLVSLLILINHVISSQAVTISSNHPPHPECNSMP